MKLAFYAPMKSPDHPVPSGDRRMGRLLFAALQRAGFDVALASELRSYDGSGDPARQAEIRDEGARQAAALIEKWQKDRAAAPDAWFTYHLYHKAPDWIGPRVTEALNIPYIVAEASHAPKRASGPWKAGYDAAMQAIHAAGIVFPMTRHDSACLRAVVAEEERLQYLPPFIDVEGFLGSAETVDINAEILRGGGRAGVHNLLAVAMMRGGDKLESYRELGQSLARLGRDDWQLLVIGDGERRADVEVALSPLGTRAVYLGAMAPGALPAWYRAADLYVWPAHGEAYGMAFLEAAACGLPVVAGDLRGVPDVVQNGRTGILTPPGDFAAFAAAIDSLMGDAARRAEMGATARAFVREERNISAAADRLRLCIERLF
ncbi:glycosyltransferase family 4 protein [Sneathiella sp.]|uniref:glycosyltransferase family 4 protein n=1 Tax=Sneathiella sp. TaxID=1964365 RepID=UPI002FDFF5FC